MAWAEVTQNPLNGYHVRTETLTLPSSASTSTPSSAIDFLPPATPFVVIGNTAAVNTNSEFDIDLQVSLDNGTTWGTIKADFIATLDTVVEAGAWNPETTSGHGYAPMYRLLLVHAGNQSGESIVVAVTYSNG